MSVNTRWSSKLTLIFVGTGIAVGLGNIWRFPTMVGQNGGGAFVAIYLSSLFIIGIPLLAGEMLVGRLARKNVSQSFQSLAAQSKSSLHWKHMGTLCFIIMLIVMAMYSMIAGWINFYIAYSATGSLNFQSSIETKQFFDNFTAHPLTTICGQSIYLLLILFVVKIGVQAGIERAAIILMPIFIGLMLLLFYYAFQHGNMSQAITFLFWPDFSKITYQGILEAISHACYTLTVGGGVMLLFGSYMPKNVSLTESVIIIAIVDTVVALLMGLIIFPIVFANHLNVSEGPGLIFMTLPVAFSHLHQGQLFMTSFFLLIFIAAFTSSVAQAEPMIMQCMESFKLKRKNAALLVVTSVWVLGILMILSFNTLSEFKLFNKWTIYQAFDDILSLVLLPVSLILFAFFIGWKINMRLLRKEFDIKSKLIFKSWLFCLRYIVILAVSLFMLMNLLNKFG